MRLTLFIFPLETVYWYLAPTKWDFLFFLWLWIKYLFSGVWLMLWPSYRTCYGNKAGGWHCSVDSSIFFFQSTIVVSISDKKKELQKFLRHSIPFSHSSPTVKVSVDENSVYSDMMHLKSYYTYTIWAQMNHLPCNNLGLYFPVHRIFLHFYMICGFNLFVLRKRILCTYFDRTPQCMYIPMVLNFLQVIHHRE